jgi:hypothetical protein
MENLKETNWAWIAGILEGEGSFAFTNNWPVLHIQMTDKDVMEKLSSYLDVSLTKPRVLKSGKICYQFSLRKTDKIKFITDQIYEYMGERRKKSIDDWREYWNTKDWTKKSLQKLGNADLIVK